MKSVSMASEGVKDGKCYQGNQSEASPDCMPVPACSLSLIDIQDFCARGCVIHGFPDPLIRRPIEGLAEALSTDPSPMAEDCAAT